MIGMKKQTACAFEPIDSLLGYHVRRLSVVTMADLAESLSPLGLTPTTASILFVVGSNDGLTQSEVGKALGILRANMTPLVARMLRRGLLQREPLDGRSQALRLSESGRTLQRQAWKTAKAHEDRMFGALSPAARARLTVQLRGIWQAKEPDGLSVPPAGRIAQRPRIAPRAR